MGCCNILEVVQLLIIVIVYYNEINKIILFFDRKGEWMIIFKKLKIFIFDFFCKKEL